MEKSITRDMTSGSPAKIILTFAIPMLIGNLFQQLYNIIDSVIVGKYVDSNALAAVGATSSLVYMITGVCFGLSAGISIVISQYFGAGDYDKVKKSFVTATYIVIGAAIILGIVGFFSTRFLLELLNTPDLIIDQSEIFMRITFAGILGTACYNGIAAVLRALGDSITPLIFLVVSCVINILLDLLFVLGFHWNVPGVAFATVISQIISAVGSIIYAITKVKLLRIPIKEWKPDREIFSKSLRLGIPVALQNFMISVSMIALQRVINNYSEIVIAANTVVTRIEQLVLQPGMSIGAALSAFAGQNIGAGRIDRAKSGLKSSSIIIIIFSLIMLPVMYFGGEYIMLMFTKKEFIEVVNTGVRAIHITCFFYSAVGMIFVTRNFLSGAGDINVPMAMGFSEVICRITFAILLTIWIGYTGIWWATGLNWLLTALVGIFRVLSGKWENKSIINRSR